MGQRDFTLNRAKKEWELYRSPKEPQDEPVHMSNTPSGAYWSTADELSRLRVLAEVDPYLLLAAYNGTRMRENWGMMDGEMIKQEASKLAKRVLLGNGAGLVQRIPHEWPYAMKLAKAIEEGKRGRG